MFNKLKSISQKFTTSGYSVYDIAAIILIWIVLILIVGIKGNFPLNDDWLFAKSVKIFIETGNIRLMNIVIMSLVSNIMWGGLFSSFLGFSFESLRISTLIISLIGIVSFYILLDKLGFKRRYILLFVFMLMLNPIFFSLSFTFMTDNFFIASILISAIFFIRYYNNQTWFNLLSAIIFSLIATFSRQIALFLPLSFFSAVILTSYSNKKKVLISIIPFTICLLSYVSFYLYLKYSNQLPGYFSYHTQIIAGIFTNPARTAKTFVMNIYFTVYDYGFFLIPLLPLFIVNFKKLTDGRFKLILLIIIAALVPQIMMIIKTIKGLPSFWNNINPGGIGVIQVIKTETLVNNHFSFLPTYFWVIISLFSVLTGTIILITALFKLFDRFKMIRMNNIQFKNFNLVFMGISVTIYWMIFGTSFFFDRYFLALLPLILIITYLIFDFRTIIFRKLTLTLSIITLLLMGYFTVSGTIDYMSWNIARWSALNYLMTEEKISPDKIDGGYEFNGWYCYKDRQETEQTNYIWWVRDNEYVVTFGEKPGYSIYKTYTYPRLMPFATDKILILKRIPNK